jgi:hypothetical protein
MNHTHHFARKKRQLQLLARRLNRLLAEHKSGATTEITALVMKIRRLVAELAQWVAAADLKKMLGAAAFLVGITFTQQAAAQSFNPPQFNPFGLASTYYQAVPAFADLDADGDLDLLVGELYGAMKYFENTGTAVNPQFAAPVVNPFGLDSTYYLAFPAFADLDNDGDQDLLVGEFYGTMKYFENTGTADNPQFAAPVQNPFGLSPTLNHIIPALADLDNDGDFDILAGGYFGILLYYENGGTAENPAFAAGQLNPFGLNTTYILSSPTFADLDNDGDLDLLVGEYYGNMQYFKNMGTAVSPAFDAPMANPFNLEPVYYMAFPAFADLDNDGDHDLLVGEYYGGMKYFENTEIQDIPLAQDIPELQVFPNPVGDRLTVKATERIRKAELFTLEGTFAASFDSLDEPLPVDRLSPGTYVLVVTYDDGRTARSRVVKE